MAGWVSVLAQGGQVTVDFAFDPSQVSFRPAGGAYEYVELAGGTLPETEPGTPWVPAQFANILVPAGARALAVETTAAEVLLRSDLLLAPAQPPHPLSEPTPSPVPADVTAYANPDPVPANAAELGVLHYMRGYAFVSVRLNPLRYLPVKQTLYLATNLSLTVQYELAAASRTTTAASPAGFFAETVAGLVANPDDLPRIAGKMDAPAGAVDYLIITSPALSNAFKNLANHRATLQGLTTRILTTNHVAANYSGTRPAGGTDLQTSIRNCISNHVRNSGTLYVILGGDNTIIPDRDCYVSCSGYTCSDMPTDLYYAGLDSSWDENANGIYGEADFAGSADEGDLAFDVIVGRIPIRTEAQASNYIAKLIRYEYSLYANSNKLMLCGDSLWNSYTDSSRPVELIQDGYSEFASHSPVSDAEIWERRMWRDLFKTNWAGTSRLFFDTLTSWDTATPGDYVQSSANVGARFNEGWHHIYFGTHGGTTTWGLESGSFGTANATALTNMVPFVYTMACLTGGFDSGEPSLSEAFLRNTSAGALVYLGCSRYGWGSPGSYRGGPSMDYAYEYYKQVLVQRRSQVGRAFAEHKAARIAYCTANGADRWVQFGMNLQGDPCIPYARPSTQLGTNAFWFVGTPLNAANFLRWPDPNTCGVASKLVHIRYRTDTYPTGTSDGSAAYTGEDQTFLHTGLQNSTPYYYAIWVSQDGVNFVEPP